MLRIIAIILMLLTFNTHGNEKQKEVCRHWVDDTVSDIVFGGAKGPGKSYVGAGLIFGDAFTYPGTQYFIARKKLNDLRKFTIPTIYEVFEHWGLGSEYYSFNGQDNLFRLYNGSTVFLLEAKWMPTDPLYQRFGSYANTRGWIEEAGEFDEAAKNNLAASIGRWKNDDYNLVGKLLQTCNPAKNYLYRDYYKKFKDGTLESWKRFVQALPQDNKRLPAGYIEHLLRTLSTSEKLRLLHGNWEYENDPATLIDYDSTVSIFSNEHVRPNGKRYITADVARFGSDKTVIRIWDGFMVLLRVELVKKKTTEVAAEIRRLATMYEVPMHHVVIDEDGIGAGVVDLLPGCKGFVAASRPVNQRTQGKDKEGKMKSENYENLKAQCAFLLAEKINANEIYEPELDSTLQDQLVEELEQIKQKNVDKEGPKGLVPKERVKELLGRSPDDGDTYIMRMYFEVAPSGKLRVI